MLNFRRRMLAVALPLLLCCLLGFGPEYDKKSRGAIIHLKNREVLEGLFLRQSKDGRNMVFIFADREGVEFSVNEKDIDALDWKDPVWLAEGKFADEYQKKAERAAAKDWEEHLKVAKWCESKNMLDSALAQQTAAYDKRVDGLPNTADAHWEIAVWCRELGLEEKSAAHTQQAYDALKGDDPASVTVDMFIRLADWCRERGLREWAKRDYTQALTLAPDNEAAKAGLAAVLKAEKDERDKHLAKYRKEKRIWEINFAIEWDCNDDELRKWEQHCRHTAHMLFTMTEGQFMIDRITVTDNSKEGNVLLTLAERGKGGGHTDGTTSWVGGLSGPGTILHEFFHGRFGLIDEHNLPCKCIMGLGNELCYKEMHDNNTKSCWEMIMDQYPMVTRPNPSWTWINNEGFVQDRCGTLKIGNFLWDTNPDLTVEVKNTEPE